jgi:hypothetical protein
MKRSILFALLALGFLTLGGCVSESVEGSTHVFTYELWISALLFIGGIAGTVIGWFVRRSSSRFGWGMIVVGPILSLAFAPSIYLDRAVVDDAHFSHRSGIWGLTSVHEVKFADIKQIRYIVEESRGRRGKKVLKYYFVCDKFEGDAEKFPINNDVAEAAAPIILEKAKERNITFIDQT